jgi:hypothetical protein
VLFHDSTAVIFERQTGAEEPPQARSAGFAARAWLIRNFFGNGFRERADKLGALRRLIGECDADKHGSYRAL